MNLASNLSSSARIHPDRAAVRLGDVVTSYAELDQRSALVAGLLRCPLFDVDLVLNRAMWTAA